MREYRMVVGIAAAAFGMTCLAIPGLDTRAGGAEEKTLRVGIVGSLCQNAPDGVLQVALRPLKSLLEAQTGLSTHLVSGGAVENLGRLVKEGKVHFGVFHGFELAWARLKNPSLKPVLVAVNPRPTQRAYLVVRRDGRVGSIGDLRGQAVALPPQSREHCRLFLERRCVAPGSTPDQFFGRLNRDGNVEDALDDVVDGKLAAVVVDGGTLEVFRELKPVRAGRLHTLLQSDPFPCAAVVYQPGVTADEMVDRFRDGMLAARSTRRGQFLLDLCRITGFEVASEDYDESLAAIAKAYPPPAPR
jgi:ABC-type phosphate/phosphonate transport system substrate-binding protein